MVLVFFRLMKISIRFGIFAVDGQVLTLCHCKSRSRTCSLPVSSSILCGYCNLPDCEWALHCTALCSTTGYIWHLEYLESYNQITLILHICVGFLKYGQQFELEEVRLGL